MSDSTTAVRKHIARFVRPGWDVKVGVYEDADAYLVVYAHRRRPAMVRLLLAYGQWKDVTALACWITAATMMVALVDDHTGAAESWL